MAVRRFYRQETTQGLRLDLDAGLSTSRVGSNWVDVSLYNNFLGNPTNNPLYETDGGGCFRFNGTNNYFLSIGTLGGLDFIQNNCNFTFNLWVKHYSNQRTEYYMGTSETTSERGFFFGRLANGVISISGTRSSAGNPTFNYTSPSNLIQNDLNWMLLTVTAEQTTPTFSLIKVYKNGTELSSNNTPKVIFSGVATRTLGVGTINSAPGNINTYVLNGSISRLQIYDRPLSGSEITTFFNSTKTRYGL